MTVSNVRIRQIIQLLTGLACLILCIIVLVTYPNTDDIKLLAWAGVSAGIGLVVGFIA
jgi:hypothetical protein